MDILGAARVEARIPQAAHSREAAVGNRPPHWANTCGHMDRDGNPADKDTVRMRRTRSRQPGEKQGDEAANAGVH